VRKNNIFKNLKVKTRLLIETSFIVLFSILVSYLIMVLFLHFSNEIWRLFLAPLLYILFPSVYVGRKKVLLGLINSKLKEVRNKEKIFLHVKSLLHCIVVVGFSFYGSYYFFFFPQPIKIIGVVMLLFALIYDVMFFYTSFQKVISYINIMQAERRK